MIFFIPCDFTVIQYFLSLKQDWKATEPDIWSVFKIIACRKVLCFSQCVLINKKFKDSGVVFLKKDELKY